ncbi:MAG: TolC family protein [Chlamydiota bacterium]
MSAQRLVSYAVLLLTPVAAWSAAQPGLPNAPAPRASVLLLAQVAGRAGAAASASNQDGSTAPVSGQSTAAPAASGQTPAGQTAMPTPPGQTAQAPGTVYPRLTLSEAEALAIKNNPRITVSRLIALASHQVMRETRSAYWPTAVVDVTGVDSQDNSRITAGGLNNPIIYPRAAAGTTVTQLITDFGRTRNLVASSSLQEKAENENAYATQLQIKLAVDQAFYNALQTRAVLQVAQQTVSERQTVADLVQALFNSKLKSSLDVSFAQVNLAQAKLLLLDAQNNDLAAMANLSALLGYATLHNYDLAEETTPLVPPPPDINQLTAEAMTKRPELAALDYSYRAAQKYHLAQRDQLLPTIRGLGVVGSTPLAGNVALAPWYGAVGINVEVPVFNGFLYSAQSHEAQLRAQAAQQRLRDLQDRIARDVRNAWLNAGTAYSRVAVTQQLLQEANLALDLSQTRYKLGLASIVELSQAQLQQTQAQISNTQANYGYRLAMAVLNFQIANF